MDDAEARDRGRALTDYWSRKHGVHATWQGDDVVTLSGKVMGVKFDGTVRIGGGTIHAEMNAGFLAERLGGRAYVERKLDDYLDPKKTLAELRARIP